MTKSLTISGVALTVFMNDYYKNNIPNIGIKSTYLDIKKAYYVGITEVYKPYGENLYYYDVNSLYPYAAINDMPGLSCNKITLMGNLSVNDLFGFFQVEVDATNVDYKYLGLLPYRKDSLLIFPHGKWVGWYFTEELKFAMKYGYKVTYISGYNFNKSPDVFEEYVHNIYKNKVEATNKTMKTIAKSLLNNLLGRFGIDINKFETKLLSNDKFEEMLLVRDVKSHVNIGNL